MGALFMCHIHVFPIHCISFTTRKLSNCDRFFSHKMGKIYLRLILQLILSVAFTQITNIFAINFFILKFLRPILDNHVACLIWSLVDYFATDFLVTNFDFSYQFFDRKYITHIAYYCIFSVANKIDHKF